jgi:hypothetical protein
LPIWLRRIGDLVTTPADLHFVSPSRNRRVLFRSCDVAEVPNCELMRRNKNPYLLDHLVGAR